MNVFDAEIMNYLRLHPFTSQRSLAAETGFSVGLVNKSLRALREEGLLREDHSLTPAAEKLFKARSPKQAVILAAGFGMRMVPINREVPKALLEVRGEVLIERQIRQLREAGVQEITVVVGFMKERFEYLIDTFGVRLAVNDEYARKNNLVSLNRAAARLENCYIVPCDIYCAVNPFRDAELHSWYMVSDADDPDSTVRVNRKGELAAPAAGEARNGMIGIAYLTEPESSLVRERLARMAPDPRHADDFWEETLADGERMILPARLVSREDAFEINTYEQLREIDADSNHLRSDALDAAAKALSVTPDRITDITVLKKGMTNRSFLFSCGGVKYIMRVPGEGTDRLINRRQETNVYEAIRPCDLCDDVVFIDPATGYKITRFVEGARVCDPESAEDLRACMARLRGFHSLALRVDHTFDIFGQIDFYESLWNGAPSVFPDYARTKEQVLALRPFIDRHRKPFVLTHIDAVPDNFLMAGGDIRLIDWEYAGMQDPDVDLAMFCIYALYDRAQCDALIDLYYTEGCPEDVRYKIYAYIAACGLLWSNWCEFKRSLGVEFGEYALRQYRYAKDFSRLVRQYEEGGGQA